MPGDDDEDVGAPMSLRRDMTMMMGMMAMGMRRRDDDDDDDEKERKDDGDTALRALPSMMAEQLLKCLALLGARFIPATSRLVPRIQNYCHSSSALIILLKAVSTLPYCVCCAFCLCQSDKYSAVLPDKRDSLFRQVAASAHDVICDFVFRQSPSSKSQIHPSLLQPFDQLTSAQQGVRPFKWISSFCVLMIFFNSMCVMLLIIQLVCQRMCRFCSRLRASICWSCVSVLLMHRKLM